MSGMHMNGADSTQGTTAAGVQPLLSYQQHLALPAKQAASACVLLQTCLHNTLCHFPAPLADLSSDACFTLRRSPAVACLVCFACACSDCTKCTC